MANTPVQLTLWQGKRLDVPLTFRDRVTQAGIDLSGATVECYFASTGYDGTFAFKLRSADGNIDLSDADEGRLVLNFLSATTDGLDPSQTYYGEVYYIVGGEKYPIAQIEATVLQKVATA